MYLPIPPRAWSRVQNECSVNTNNSNLTYDVFTKTYVPNIIGNESLQMLIKGNILQYKKNSSNLTKKQQYSQISKGLWTNRTKTWATQSQTYSNPNTTGLQRTNYSTLAATANTPFVSNIYSIPPNPFGCPITSSEAILDGGSLICNTYVNPCTGDVIKKTKTQICNLSTDSNVPGKPMVLCWNNGIQTWYTKNRYTMNNSSNKWPTGYKGLISSLKPEAPILTLDNIVENSVFLSWTFINKLCIPISSFNLYQILDGVTTLIQNILFPLSSIEINNLNNTSSYTFYITSVSYKTESEKSNEIIVYI
jgi:hypothetical protein